MHRRRCDRSGCPGGYLRRTIERPKVILVTQSIVVFLVRPIVHAVTQPVVVLLEQSILVAVAELHQVKVFLLFAEIRQPDDQAKCPVPEVALQQPECRLEIQQLEVIRFVRYSPSSQLLEFEVEQSFLSAEQFVIPIERQEGLPESVLRAEQQETPGLQFVAPAGVS